MLKFLLLLVLNCIAWTNNATVRAIFENVEALHPVQGKVFGSTPGVLYAFAQQPGGPISRRYAGLFAPNYQVPVSQDGSFSFQMLAKGTWLIGVYSDLNGNALVDLLTEQVWIYPGSPYSHPSQGLNINLDLDAVAKFSLDVSDWPSSDRLGVHILSNEGTGLFSLPLARGMNLSLPILDEVQKFQILRDDNGDGVLEPGDEDTPVYSGPFVANTDIQVTYGVPFRPFSLTMHSKPDRLEVCLYSDYSKPPKSCSMTDKLSLLDLEPGKWFLQFIYPFDDDVILFVLDEIEHSSASILSHQFNEEVQVALKDEIPQNWVELRVRDQILARIHPSALSRFPFLLKEHYDLIFYETEDPWSSNTFGKRNLQWIRLDLRQDFSKWALELPKAPKQNVSGILLYHSMQTDAQGLILQKSDFSDIFESLASVPLSAMTTAHPVQFRWHRLDPVLVCLDLDKDLTISEYEKPLCKEHDPKTLDKRQAVLQFADWNVGTLSIVTERKGNFYIQVINSQGQMIRADFLNGLPLDFYQLPVLQTLQLTILHDVNENGLLDEEDVNLDPLIVEISPPKSESTPSAVTVSF